VLSEAANGLLLAVVFVTAFPVVIPEMIRLTNAAATAIGSVDLGRYVGASGGVDSAIVRAVFLIVLLFFAFRLLLKCIWRIGFLAVLLPVGMLACALYASPSTRWVLGWWVRLWGGMLLAQIPSVMALLIGAQLYAGGGVLGFVYATAFLQLATDLYSLVPFSSTGGSGGAPWGAIPWRRYFLSASCVRGRGALDGALALASLPAANQFFDLHPMQPPIPIPVHF
jgi:hypothetical protein